MNNNRLSFTRIVRRIGEPLNALFITSGPFFSWNRAESQFSNRINSLEPIAPQPALTAFSRINSLAPAAPQFSTQKLRGSTQKRRDLCGECCTAPKQQKRRPKAAF
jgi:hypothetical protein